MTNLQFKSFLRFRYKGALGDILSQKRRSKSRIKNGESENLHSAHHKGCHLQEKFLIVIGAKLADQEIIAQFVVGGLLCITQGKNLCILARYMFVYKWFTQEGKYYFSMMPNNQILCIFLYFLAVDDVVLVSWMQYVSNLLANTIRSPSREIEKHKHILTRSMFLF